MNLYIENDISILKKIKIKGEIELIASWYKKNNFYRLWLDTRDDYGYLENPANIRINKRQITTRELDRLNIVDSKPWHEWFIFLKGLILLDIEINFYDKKEGQKT